MTEKYDTLMQDKKSIMQLFAGFMKHPDLLVDKEFKLSEEDFPEKFHKIIYGAMFNLYTSGVESLNPIEIDTYIGNYDIQYRIFNDNDGIDVLYKLEETDDLGKLENMKYHYNRVRKFSLLRKCVEMGIDIRDILDLSVVDIKEIEAQNEKLDAANISDIIRHLETKIVEIKDTFHSEEANGSHMAEDAEGTLEEIMESPSYGRSLSSGLLTRIVRGARLTKLMMRSSNTGGGKSRYALADLCSICIPEIWDLEQEKWVLTGNNESGLFITTELSKDEIQLPVLCYITGIPEYRLLDNNISAAERKRLKYALQILEKSKLYIEHLSNFDIDDVEHAIERNVIRNNVKYVVFDYIHSSMKMMQNMAKNSSIKMREDQVLLLFADTLKQICNRLDVWILTGTQLNDAYKAEGGINLDASSLRGARALGDKLDVGMIMLRLTPEDEKILQGLRENSKNGELPFGVNPSHTITIFKNRRGEHVNVKVWLEIDLGNLRTKDCFVTDMQGRIKDVKPVKVKYVENEYDELPEAFEKGDERQNLINF